MLPPYYFIPIINILLHQARQFYRDKISPTVAYPRFALSNKIANVSWWSCRGIRIRCMNAHCVCIDLVGRVITIRSAYKGMHQEGNKSGAHRESICFHLHGRTARMGSRGEREGETPDGKGHKEDGGERREFLSEGTAKSRELFMEWLLKSYGWALHSQNMLVRATCHHRKRPPLMVTGRDPRSCCFSWKK